MGRAKSVCVRACVLSLRKGKLFPARRLPRWIHSQSFARQPNFHKLLSFLLYLLVSSYNVLLKGRRELWSGVRRIALVWGERKRRTATSFRSTSVLWSTLFFVEYNGWLRLRCDGGEVVGTKVVESFHFIIKRVQRSWWGWGWCCELLWHALEVTVHRLQYMWFVIESLSVAGRIV